MTELPGKARDGGRTRDLRLGKERQGSRAYHGIPPEQAEVRAAQAAERAETPPSLPTTFPRHLRLAVVADEFRRLRRHPARHLIAATTAVLASAVLSAVTG